LPQGEDPNTFSCSREIRIDHTKVSDLDGVSYYENFPMLVKFSGDNALKLGSCGEIYQADGSDIMFTDSSDTVLDHEIEEYDGTSGTLVAWVKIPQLNTTSATDITMHYGKETLQCGTDNPTGVWDDDYVGVWHFKESSGSGSYLKNSKQDAYHADPDSSSPFVADAKIAGGRDVNQIDFDSGGDLLDGDTAFTLSFWGYPNYASDAEWQADEAHMFNTDSMWGLRWSRNSGNDPGTGWIQADVKFTSGTNYFNHWNDLLRAQWNHIVLNYNGSALRWYINGSMVKQSTGYTGQALVSNSTIVLQHD
jgi:MSHA biogenesis protein MshQ